jgi:hypothetical protein
MQSPHSKAHSFRPLRGLKKAGRESSGVYLKKRTYLERELQRQLHGATATGADYRIGSGNVWRSASASEGLDRRVVQAETVLAAVRICEVRMVENVEKFGTELRMKPVAEVKILCY